LGVGALDDNHALSLQRINAYQPPPPSPWFYNSTMNALLIFYQIRIGFFR
jgi:hypothetical protein